MRIRNVKVTLLPTRKPTVLINDTLGYFKNHIVNNFKIHKMKVVNKLLFCLTFRNDFIQVLDAYSDKRLDHIE